MARATLGNALKKGDRIGDEFEVVNKLGEGGCGTVFRCRWTKKPTIEVAVKVLDRDGDVARFTREAKVLRRVRHLNVVKLIGSGYHEDRPYIALEFVEGGSVRDLMDRFPSGMPVEEAAWILVQTVRGLRASGTVHRDLKPENLLLTPGEGRAKTPKLVINDAKKGAVVKVADFGLAREMDLGQTRLTHSGQVMGTPVYMSPEQCRSTKKVSFKTDVYAIGIIFFEMITGKVPFDAPNAYDIMKKHLEEEPKLGRLAKAPREVIAKCLEKAPGKRYASLRALEKDLCALAGIGVENVERGGGGSGRLVAIVVIGLALLGTIAWLLRDRLAALF